MQSSPPHYRCGLCSCRTRLFDAVANRRRSRIYRAKFFLHPICLLGFALVLVVAFVLPWLCLAGQLDVPSRCACHYDEALVHCTTSAVSRCRNE
jgi:hypothetical protein